MYCSAIECISQCPLFRHLNVQKWSEPVSFFTLLTWTCASRHAHFFDIWTSKSGPTTQFFTLLTWKCASRHKGVHLFDISTSKSGVSMVCFVHFDLETCFTPQRRALFRHLNIQKSGPNVKCFYIFYLHMCFAPQRRLKVLRSWGALYILTWKCASRHNCVQLLMSHLARWLRTAALACFSDVTFRPSGATNHWKKHSESWLSDLFAHLHLLSSHFFSSLIFSLLFFSSLTLPTSAFPSLHIVGSLTSKLPSTRCSKI